MVSFRIAAAALVAISSVNAESNLRASSVHRKLSFEAIANYQPKTLVTDHNAIDLDQAEMERQLALASPESYVKAKAIYENGAFSKSVATVTLTVALTGPLNDGKIVTGMSKDDVEIKGKVLGNFPTGTKQIKVQYQTNSFQSSYVGCQVGANPSPVTEGCFKAVGQITIEGESASLYSYDPLKNNRNERTLQGFSTQAEDKMGKCENCPYVTYEKFYQYYGAYDYANQWVLAAFDGGVTPFTNGNADFGSYGYPGKTEAIKKGTAYMSVYMYVIREMEDALDDCKEGCETEECNDDPVHAWDEAVAFYSGSLESTDGSGAGVLLHQLADKRCQNFKTCGDLANEASGLSHVNLEIIRHFKDGLRKVTQGECSAARDTKDRIEQLMAVPLVQATIRYAWINDFEIDAGEKAEAEGAVFAAAVLPLVNACSEDDADTIYKNMKVGRSSANFKSVKHAFERNYGCLGIRCEDVGGLYDSSTGGYLKHASPCGSASSSNDDVWKIVGISVGSVVGLALIVCIISRCSRKSEPKGLTPDTPADPTVDLQGEGAVVS